MMLLALAACALLPGAASSDCSLQPWYADDEGACDDVEGWHLLALQPEAIVEISPTDGTAEVFAETDWVEGMFAADVRADGLAFAASDTAYTIDHCSGQRREIGALETRLQGVAFDASNRLLGLSRHDDVIVEVEVETGTLTPLTWLDFDLGLNGLTYDPERGVFYGLDADAGQIFTVDPDSGEASDFLDVSLAVDIDYVGMAYNPTRQTLWVTTGTALVELDPVTGDGDLIGFHGDYTGINDLALFPPCD